MKRTFWITAALGLALTVAHAPQVLGAENGEQDATLSAYQWGYWGKMASPAAGPINLIPMVNVAPAPEYHDQVVPQPQAAPPPPPPPEPPPPPPEPPPLPL